MKKIMLTFMVIVAGLSVTALDINAQNKAQSKFRQDMDKWHKDMAEFRARSEQRRALSELTDSIAGVQAAAAVRNQDFVLEANQVTFKNGATVFVDSNTTFISVKGNRAVVQISPSNFAAGPEASARFSEEQGCGSSLRSPHLRQWCAREHRLSSREWRGW